jgi:hypothetical protein
MKEITHAKATAQTAFGCRNGLGAGEPGPEPEPECPSRGLGRLFTEHHPWVEAAGGGGVRLKHIENLY